MKFLYLFSIFVIIQFAHISTVAAEDYTTPELKKGAAVTAFTKEDGFKLSKKAIDNLGITFYRLNGDGPWEVNKSALVYVKHSIGIYRKWDGWITMVLVKVLSETETTVTIESVDLQNKDLIAITGVLFLRMTDADLNSSTVDSCAH